MRSSLERTMANGLFLGIGNNLRTAESIRTLSSKGYLIRHRIYEKGYLAKTLNCDFYTVLRPPKSIYGVGIPCCLRAASKQERFDDCSWVQISTVSGICLEQSRSCLGATPASWGMVVD